MAKIPIGNFGNAVAQAPQQVNYLPLLRGDGVGTSLQELGNEGMKVAIEIRDEANKTRVDEAWNKAVQANTDLKTEALQLRGKNALERPDGQDLPTEYTNKLQESLDLIEVGLGNEVQRRAFKTASNDLKRRMYADMAGHALAESKQYRLDTWTDTNDIAIKQSNLLWGDEQFLAESRKTITDTVCELAKFYGWDDKTKANKMADALSNMHDGVIRGMVDGERMDLAKAYYDENVATMTIDARARAMRLIETGDFERKTQEGAEAVMALSNGNIEEALKLAREKYSGKEEDAIVTRLWARQREQETVTNETEKAAKETAYDHWNNGKKIPASIIAAMNPVDWRHMQESMRIAAERGRGGGDGDKELRDEAYFTIYQDEQALAGAGTAEIISLRRRGFTQSQVDSLLRQKQRLADEADTVAINKRLMDSAFLKQGIGNKTNSDKALRGKIESNVDQEIFEEQQIKKRKLTREEQQAIINRQFSEVQSYYKERGVFSTKTGTRPRKYYEVEMKESIVVPQADRNRYTKRLIQQGVQVTDERIREMYLQGLGR